MLIIYINKNEINIHLKHINIILKLLMLMYFIKNK